MKKLTILILACIIMISCSFRGFKPPPDVSAYWKLNKAYDNTKNLSEYIEKMERDFRQGCNLDPTGGSWNGENQNVHSELDGYLCLEEKGWYYTKGPVCLVKWRFFDDPKCVEWRKQRGLINAPRPKKYTT